MSHKGGGSVSEVVVDAYGRCASRARLDIDLSGCNIQLETEFCGESEVLESEEEELDADHGLCSQEVQGTRGVLLAYLAGADSAIHVEVVLCQDR